MAWRAYNKKSPRIIIGKLLWICEFKNLKLGFPHQRINSNTSLDTAKRVMQATNMIIYDHIQDQL